MPVYLDCNATTPVEPEVLDAVVDYMKNEFGNEGSWTHDFGTVARETVELARKRVATVVDARAEEVTFTSGATESNNLAILGLARFGERRRRKHIITTSLEHRAVLGPLSILEQQGFQVTYLKPNPQGLVSAEELSQALREETLLVSVMHVNNETGVIQPLDGIAEAMRDHAAYLHVDAAQGFGKELTMLKSPRIDMISVSGHKVYAPQGIGVLIARKRGVLPLPLEPLMYGGGKKRGCAPAPCRWS
jgi:cysteine desulfurase